ncbi:MAG: glycosyltransferase family 39 protein [Candidatus Omnitrophota bacterium]
MYIKKIPRNIFDGLIISSIIFIFALRNNILSFFCKFPFGIDSFSHIYNTIRFEDHLGRVLIEPENIKAIYGLFRLINLEIYRPPLYYIIAVAINFFVRNLISTEVYIIPLIFFIFTLFYTFKTSEFLKKGSGIFSALFLSIFPGIVNCSAGINLYWLELSLVTIAMHYFLKSDLFQDKKNSAIFAVFFALGMLAKRQFASFFLGPFIAAAWFMLSSRKKLYYKNLIPFVLLNLSIGLLFTAHQLPFYWKIWPFVNSAGEFFKELWLYLTFLSESSSPLFIALFLVSAGKILHKKADSFLILFSSVAGIFILYPFVIIPPGQHSYYLLPLLPTTAIFISVYFIRAKERIFTIFLCSAIILQPVFLNLNMTKHHFPVRAVNTYQILNLLHRLGLNNTTNLKMGMISGAKDCLLTLDLPVLLKMEGVHGFVGDYGESSIRNFCAYKGEYDVFIYVSDDIKAQWFVKDLLKKRINADSFIPSSVAGEEDINRLFDLKENLIHLATVPYFIAAAGKPFYVNIFVKNKNI